MKITLSSLMDFAKDMVAQYYKDNPASMFAPTFLGTSEGGVLVIMASPLPNPDDIDPMVEAAKKALREHGATHYVFVAETWASEIAYETGADPSMCSDRVECICLHAGTATTAMSRYFQIERDGAGWVSSIDKPYLREKEGPLDDESHRMTTLLKPEAPVDDAIDARWEGLMNTPLVSRAIH